MSLIKESDVLKLCDRFSVSRDYVDEVILSFMEMVEEGSGKDDVGQAVHTYEWIEKQAKPSLAFTLVINIALSVNEMQQ